MYKKYCFRYITSFETVRICIHIKQLDPDPYQIEKQDPDLYQSEKQDPDPYQRGLDPQNCRKHSADYIECERIHRRAHSKARAEHSSTDQHSIEQTKSSTEQPRSEQKCAGQYRYLMNKVTLS